MWPGTPRPSFSFTLALCRNKVASGTPYLKPKPLSRSLLSRMLYKYQETVRKVGTQLVAAKAADRPGRDVSDHSGAVAF